MIIFAIRKCTDFGTDPAHNVCMDQVARAALFIRSSVCVRASLAARSACRVFGVIIALVVTSLFSRAARTRAAAGTTSHRNGRCAPTTGCGTVLYLRGHI
jgi:hypothetical protein